MKFALDCAVISPFRNE